MLSPRVLQVVLNLSPGGTERLVIELAQRLHGRYHMAVCCLDEPGAWAQELESQGIQVTCLGRRPGFRPGLGRRLAEVARAHRADVLHCHHYSPFVYGVIAKWWHPARIVFTEHGRANDGPPSRKRKIANHLFASVPANVFAVSAHLRDHMIEEGFASDTVGVIYNGIDIGPLPSRLKREEVRARLGLSPADILIGAVGRLVVPA